ncbi:type II toxin-antitoxin system VapC family toxin [Candidatus Micrarchaeota archaeon]|nr:type II toxin-antitoxin system VapC family toxin [Candidatus Micrarchaeota archaeon]
MLFFDTSAAVAWLRGDESLKKEADDEGVAISVITVYELLWAARRKSRRAVEGVELFLDGSTILPLTHDIARRAAHLKAEVLAGGKDKPMADLIIAATAEKEGLKFLSSDKDFADIRRFADIDLHMI